MRLKLSLGEVGQDRDLQVTVDAMATIGDLAERLARVTGANGSAARTLRNHGLPSAARAVPPVVLDPELPVSESPLRSGVRVTIAESSANFSQESSRGAPAASLRVIEGPDKGREFTLPFGSSIVGRDQKCDVALRDGFVSKRHIRVSVTETIEVVDLGSANGIHLDGEVVQRAVVRPEDRVSLGDSVIALSPLVRLAAESGTGVGFNRRPLVQSPFVGPTIDAPETPQETRGMRFPIVAMMAPLVLGLVMLAVTRSPTVVIFVALSPLLMLGSFVDQRRQSRAENRKARHDFEHSLVVLREELGELHDTERGSRLVEHPSTAQATEAVETLGARLWFRRPDQPGFLDLRLGLGSAVSRTQLKLPDRRRATADDWKALTSIQSDFAAVSGVPIVASLRDAGGVGVAGPESVMTGVARGLLVQLIGYHSPAELAIVAVGNATSSTPWEWLKWVPHVGSAHSPVAGMPLANNAVNALRLVARVEELIDARKEDGRTHVSGARSVPLPALVMVVLDDAPVERSRLVHIAETGPEVGVHVLWCAGSVAQIPAACRAFIELGADGAGEIGLVHADTSVNPVVCEYVDDDVALHVARRLSPVADAGARVRDDSDLPRNVSFLASLGTELGRQPDAIVERWNANDPTLSGGPPRKEALPLRAVVGHGSSDVFALDLRVHGPHSLVGGTTGAGKSEFLLSWVLGMATTQSPRRVTFLFVDYKGGSAFGSCTKLPHSVGMVTDLSPHLVRRALTSLRAEVTFREEHLKMYAAKDLLELEKNPEAPQLPSLVIVVDEFAALLQEVPDFIDGVIDVAQRGRSLGLHLILATQRPTGVITPGLRANTNLRIALRMAEAEDSSDVLGDALAAGFDPAIPGRAAAKTGPGRISTFQSLYVGGETPDVPPRPEIQVETLVFGQGETLEAESVLERKAASTAVERKDIDKVVEQIQMANRVLQLSPPRPPWIDVLADVYDWELLGQRSDTALVIGVQDQPQKQASHNVHFRPDDDGNMVVFGTGGSGKSTLLRTIAASAAVTPRGGPCDVYGLDFSSRGLSMLGGLPHVGAVITGNDHERVARLLRWLRSEVEQRAQRYNAASASTISEYRANAGRPDEKRILVLIDGFAGFRQEYELGGRSAWFNVFGQLAADGRAVGVHFVISADRPGAIPPSLAATIQRRVTLRLSDSNDYTMAGEPADILSADSPPGRGILGGYEIQVAVVGASASLPEQVAATKELGRRLGKRGQEPARPIQRLSERIPLTDLAPAPSGRITVGVSDDDLGPFSVEASGMFLVVGPPSSGRTTSLATLVQSFEQNHGDAPRFLFGAPRSRLSGLAGWTATATDEDSASGLAAKVDALIRDTGSSATSGLIVIEGIDASAGMTVEEELESLVKLAAERGMFVVGEAETSALVNAFGGLAQAFKLARRGLALQPEEMDGVSVFKTAFPRMTRSEFPVGRGVVVDAGSTVRVQMCLPE